jgi:hypothetical protein
MKIHYSDPSMDRSVKIIRQLEQDFEPYRMEFRGLNEKEKQLPLRASAKEIKTLIPKKVVFIGRGGFNYSRIFAIRKRPWDLVL